MAWELKDLMPHHQRIIDLCLAGYDKKEIALAMEMTPTAISMIVNSPNFQHDLARRRASMTETIEENVATVKTRAKEILERGTEKAALVQNNLLDSASEKMRLQASQAILDRCFGEKGQVTNNVLVLDEKALAALQAALRESDEAEKTIDVTAKELVA